MNNGTDRLPAFLWIPIIVGANASFIGCDAENGGAVLREISGFEHSAFRFFEYVVIGYVLLGLSRIYGKIKNLRKGGETNFG